MSFWKDDRVAQFYKAGERLTAPPARHMIRQSGLLQQLEHADLNSLVILDNACGTGVLTSQLYDMLGDNAKERLQLTCSDYSEAMVEAMQQKIDASGWKGAKAQVADAQNTGLPSGHYTHVFTNFAFHILPDSAAALDECVRILKPGGVCALSTWVFAGIIPDVLAALATIPGAPQLPDHEALMSTLGSGPWYRADFVAQQLAAHGFVDAKVDVVPVNTTMESVGAYLEQFGEMIGQLVEKSWSVVVKDSSGRHYSGLLGPALLRYMTEKYGEDVPFELKMVAVVATARTKN